MHYDGQMSLTYLSLRNIGGHSAARIHWLEFKGRSAGSGQNFSQGIQLLSVKCIMPLLS